MCNQRNGTFYVGVKRNLWQRVLEHKHGRSQGFSKDHRCTRLVWFQRFDLLIDAIRHEKRVKRWRRDFKLQEIEAANPEWRDLYDEIARP